MDGMTPEHKKAINCIKNYEPSIEKAIKKIKARGELLIMTPELNAMFKELKEAYLTLNMDGCVRLAGLLKTELEVIIANGDDGSDIEERLKELDDFILPRRVEIVKMLFEQTVGMAHSCKLMSNDEITMNFNHIKNLMTEAKQAGVSHKHLAGVVSRIKIIERNLPISNDIAVKTENKEEQMVMSEARNKLIAAIDWIKMGKIEQAEQALDIVEGLLIGYENSEEGVEISKALVFLAGQIEQYKKE